jgi:hypothetical protein
MSTPAGTTPAPAAPHETLLQRLGGYVTKFESGVGLATHEMPIAARLFQDIIDMIDGLHQTTGIPAPTGGQQ